MKELQYLWKVLLIEPDTEFAQWALYSLHLNELPVSELALFYNCYISGRLDGTKRAAALVGRQQFGLQILP